MIRSGFFNSSLIISYESDKEVQKHLVFVDALKGLQKEDCVAACEIMNRQ